MIVCAKWDRLQVHGLQEMLGDLPEKRLVALHKENSSALRLTPDQKAQVIVLFLCVYVHPTNIGITRSTPSVATLVAVSHGARATQH